MIEHKLPNGTAMFCLQRGECVFLWEEIFARACYDLGGLGLAAATGCIIDVGANIGMASYYFHTMVPGIRIHAFEPSPPVFAVLQANVERLGINAVLYPCALGATPGIAKFTIYPENSIMSGLFADVAEDQEVQTAYMVNEGMDREDAEFMAGRAFAATVITCPVRTLSEIIVEQQIERIELLKIDVEKAEMDVVRGVRPEHWPMIQRVFIEIHDREGRLGEITAMFEKLGFTTRVRQDPKLKGTNLYDVYANR